MTDALVEEATRRSGVVWLRPEGGGREHLVWHVWHDGAAWLVTGGREQPVPATDRVTVVVRSRARQADRVVEWEAAVEPVAPGTARWDEVVPLLHAARLNAPDGEEQPQRWARESTVLRLVPTGRARRPAAEDLVAAPPVPTPATSGPTAPLSRA